MSWTQKGPNFSKAECSSPSLHLFSVTHTLVFNGGLHEKHQRYSPAFTCKQSKQAKKVQIKDSLQILVFSNVLLSTEIKRKQITIFLQSI